MRILFLLPLLACLLLPSAALALSDADYKAYLKTPAFAEAERRLGAAWKQVKAKLPKNAYAKALGEQRVWLASRRDADAAALAGQNAPGADAYAAATIRRVEELEALISRHGAPVPPPAPAAHPVFPATAAPAEAPEAQPAAQAGSPAVPDAASAPAGQTTPGAPGAQQPAAPAKGRRPQPAGQPAGQNPAQPFIQPPIQQPPIQQPPVQQPPVQQPHGQAAGQPALRSAPQASPVPQGQPQAVPQQAPAGSPALPPAPLSAPPMPDAENPLEMLAGSYISPMGELGLSIKDGALAIELDTAAPDGKWQCFLNGQAVISGTSLIVHSPGLPAPVAIQVRGNSLVVPDTADSLCGSGGTMAGTYTRQ